MIKLKDILIESITDERDASIDTLKDMSKQASILKNYPIMYRGFSGGRKSWLMKVENDQTGFRGALNKNVVKIMSKLNKKFGLSGKNMAFVTISEQSARFFGNAYVFIPKSPFKVVYNKNIKDMHADISDKIPDEELDTLLNGYVNKIPTTFKGEVLVDSKYYYLLSYKRLNELLPPKLKQKQINTYKDIQDMFNKYIWLKNKQKENR